MTSLSSFANPAAWHVLTYGALLGTTIYQSFVSGIIAFRVLPRPQFGVLQQHTFPVYFLIQTIAPFLLSLTHPAGPKSLLTLLSSDASPFDRRSAFLIKTMVVAGLANCAYIGPQTTKTMKERKRQETKDGKRSYDAPPHSEEMKKLNKKFGILHGVSTLVNLGGLVSMIWYGGLLGERLKL